MKNNMKKVLSVLLAVLLLSCMFVVASAAEPDYELFYGINENPGSKITCHVNGYANSLGDAGLLEIPASIFSDPITVYLTSVSDNAFAFRNPTDANATKYNAEMKELVIAAGVAKIGSYAFYNLANLEKVTIKGDVSLGEFAFANCANLKTVVFEGKNINVGASAFAGCTKLINIRFADNVELNTGVNAFNDTKWFSEYPTDFVIAGTTLVAYVGKDASVSIPLSITKIGNGAFKGNDTLEEITFTQNIVSLGDEAFMDCSALTTVNYCKAVVFDYVGLNLFTNTPYYNKYESDFFCIGSRLVKYLGDDVDVVIPNTVTEIAADAFNGCYTKSGDGTVSYQVSSIRIPVSVKNFEDNCFTLYEYPDAFVPVLYVAKDTAGAEYAAEKGYNHVVLSIPGDVDADTVVTAADARETLRIAVGCLNPTLEACYVADVDGDYFITAADARTILRVAVGLDEISAEALQNKPTTKTEILNYYADALENAAELQAGYTKKITAAYASDITDTKDCSIDSNTYLYLKPIVEKDSSVINSMRAYESNTEAAAANLVGSALICEDAVEYAACILEDGKYYITIVMNTEEAVTDDTFVSDIYPVAPRSHFDSMISSASWSTAINNWFDFDLFYKDCVISAVVDVETQQIESIDMGVTYFFDNIDGSINLIHVTNWGRTSGTGYASRYDTISYSNFVY